MNPTLWKINSDIEDIILGVDYALTTAHLAFENYHSDVQSPVAETPRMEDYEAVLNVVFDRIHDEKAKLEMLNERLFQYAGTGEAKAPIYRKGAK